MFVRNKQLQYPVRVDRPNPVFAKQVQELIGGVYGEFTVMVQYLAQGWSLRGAEGNPTLTMIKDMLLDTAAEEIMHVEMLATMVGMLLNGASPEQQAAGASANPAIAAVMGGMNPQHMIVSGLGAMYADSNGNPWSGSYVTAGGNVAADMYTDAIYEMQGRLQTARVYEMTDDPGIRDTLSFMLARDLLHQQQFLAAVEELGGPTAVLPIPAQMTADKLGENSQYAYAFMSYAQNPADTTAGQGRWANGPSLDGKGQYSYIAEPFALGLEANLPPAPAKVFGGLPGDPVGDVQMPRQAMGGSSMTPLPSTLTSPFDEKVGHKMTVAEMADTASGVRVGAEDPVVTVNEGPLVVDKTGDPTTRPS